MSSACLDAVGLCIEVVNLLLLSPDLVGQLLLLVCERVRLTVQPPINCMSDNTQPSANDTWDGVLKDVQVHVMLFLSNTSLLGVVFLWELEVKGCTLYHSNAFNRTA